MDEYIKREIIREALYQLMRLPSTSKLWQEVNACINDIPVADVKPVVRGKWIKDDETGELICSVCYSGKPTKATCSSVIEHRLNNYEIRYCYYCGAIMDNDE